MLSRSPERILRRAVADLATCRGDDQAAVLALLAPAERSRVARLLSNFAGLRLENIPGEPVILEQLTPALRRRCRNMGPMTPAARTALTEALEGAGSDSTDNPVPSPGRPDRFSRRRS